MHPNEGSDLGLFTTSHSVEWCTDILPEEFLKGNSGSVRPLSVELMNECPHNTVQINVYEWEHIGAPEKAVVFLDGKRLFMHGAKNAQKVTK